MTHEPKVRPLGGGFLSPPYRAACSCGWESEDDTGNVLTAQAWGRRHLEDVGAVKVHPARPGLKIRRHRPRPEEVPRDRTGPDRPGSTY